MLNLSHEECYAQMPQFFSHQGRSYQQQSFNMQTSHFLVGFALQVVDTF